MIDRFVLAAATVAALPGVAAAQAYHCAVPRDLAAPHPDLPNEREPQRLLPIGGYTLAISWSPQYCRTRMHDPAARMQCGKNRFGFVLHGLWPDGEGKDWPQYCTATDLVPPKVIAANLCATPSVQLLQHEWAKHGTCMKGETPATFFRRSTAMYGKLRYPDMNALSRRPLTAGQFAAALSRANPGMRADMMRITANREGWLDEVWLCTDKGFNYTTCPAHQGGLAPDARLKIWRGPR